MSNKSLKIVIGHGFLVRDKGKGSVDKLEGYIRKEFPNAIIDKDSADYGFTGLLIANYLWRLPFVKIIPRIATALQDTDVVIGHSNFANFCMQALKRIDNKEIGVFFCSGALNRRWKFKQDFKYLHNMHSRNDRIVRASRWLPFSPWGSAGNKGFKTIDKRVYNSDCTDWINDHSDYFLDENIKRTAKEICDKIKGEL